MPHITVQAPQHLARQIDWRKCFADIHKTLAGQGYSRVQDFKSRVTLLHDWQIADAEPSATIIFATLQTTNPRPAEMLQAMGQLIHERLEQEVKAVAGNDWVQCCVLVQNAPTENYFKSHFNAPPMEAGAFKVG